jgi:hypothetical protein
MLQRYCQAAVRFHQISRHAVQLREMVFGSIGPNQHFNFINSRPMPYCLPCCFFASRTPVLCSASESHSKESDSLEKNETDIDFFGIEEYEREVASQKDLISSEKDNSGALEKLAQSAQKLKSVRERKIVTDSHRSQASKKDDNILQTSFGLVRLDRRRTESTKKSDLNSEQASNIKSSSGTDFIDDQYFQYEGSRGKSDTNQTFIHFEEELKDSSRSMDVNSNLSPRGSDHTETPANIFDEQYFGTDAKQNATEVFSEDIENELEGKSDMINRQSQSQRPQSDDLNIFDQQMFGHVQENSEAESKSAIYSVIEEENTESEIQPAIYSMTEDMEKQLRKNEQQKSMVKPAEQLLYEYHEPETRRKQWSKMNPVANTEAPKTAYDMAMKIRQETKDNGRD